MTELANASMIVRNDGTAATASEIVGDWDNYAKAAVKWAIALVLIALLASLIEWWADCLRPLSYLSLTAIPIAKIPAPGWNLTHFLSGGQISAATVAAFGVVAFLGQACIAGAFLVFIAFVVAFASWVFRYTSDESAWELFPNPASDDPRRGFEHFEIFIENLLLAALALFVMFFMTRLQYLYNDSDARSIAAFISSDVAAGFFHGIKQLFTAANPDIFSVGKRITYSTAMVGTAAGLEIILAFLVPAILVRQAATRSRARFLNWMNHHNQAVTTLYGIDPTSASTALAKMEFWPMRYPTLIQLLVCIAVAGLCFVCYKFALLLLGALLYSALNELRKIFKSN